MTKKLVSFQGQFPVKALTDRSFWTKLVEDFGEDVNLEHGTFPSTHESVPNTFDYRKWFLVNWEESPSIIKEFISSFFANREKILPKTILDRWEFTVNKEGSLLLRKRQPKKSCKNYIGTKILAYNLAQNKIYWDSLLDEFGENINLRMFEVGQTVPRGDGSFY